MDINQKREIFIFYKHNIILLLRSNNNNNDNHTMVCDITPVAAITTSFRIQARRVLIFVIFFSLYSIIHYRRALSFYDRTAVAHNNKWHIIYYIVV